MYRQPNRASHSQRKEKYYSLSLQNVLYTPKDHNVPVHAPYTEDEFLHSCVQNMNLYMVLATHQAIKNCKKNPPKVLNYTTKNN